MCVYVCVCVCVYVCVWSLYTNSQFAFCDLGEAPAAAASLSPPQDLIYIHTHIQIYIHNICVSQTLWCVYGCVTNSWYIYIHIYRYIYMNTYVYIHLYVFLYVYMYLYIWIQIYISTSLPHTKFVTHPWVRDTPIYTYIYLPPSPSGLYQLNVTTSITQVLPTPSPLGGYDS